MVPRFWMGIYLACSCALFAPGAALAASDPDADASEVNAYVLTESGLAKFTQAAQNLAEMGDVLAAACDDESDDQSLDGMVARIRGAPGAAEAIESAGMPVREYVVFIFSMVQTGFAAWMVEQPGGELPPGTSMDNVEFYRAHQSELQAAADLMEAVDCESAGGDGDDDSDTE